MQRFQKIVRKKITKNENLFHVIIAQTVFVAIDFF